MDIEADCTLTVVDPGSSLLENFDCGHEDLNDFFRNDCIDYSRQLMGKTYAFVLNEDPNTPVCAFTISNDALQAKGIPNARKKKVQKLIPSVKRFSSFPAVKIGRLGVSVHFKKRGVGVQVMDFIKIWFVINNKTGCRFITVDSYNEAHPRGYYERCGFDTLFSSDIQEYCYNRKIQEEEVRKEDIDLKTKAMYFDLSKVEV